MEYIGSFIYDKVALKADVRMVIYGNGKMGKNLFGLLESMGRKEKLDCICDANEELWGTRYNGVQIISPTEAVREKRDCHFLTVGKYVKEQVTFLQSGGIKNIHVFLEL